MQFGHAGGGNGDGGSGGADPPSFEGTNLRQETDSPPSVNHSRPADTVKIRYRTTPQRRVAKRGNMLSCTHANLSTALNCGAHQQAALFEGRHGAEICGMTVTIEPQGGDRGNPAGPLVISVQNGSIPILFIDITRGNHCVAIANPSFFAMAGLSHTDGRGRPRRFDPVPAHIQRRYQHARGRFPRILGNWARASSTIACSISDGTSAAGAGAP